MDDKAQAMQSTGLPRPTSRLPMPRSSTTAALRQSPSKDNLANGGRARNPRLRPAASRDRLVSANSNSTRENEPIPAPTVPSRGTNHTRPLTRPRPASNLPDLGSHRLPRMSSNGTLGQTRSQNVAHMPNRPSPRAQPASSLAGLRTKAPARWVPASQSIHSSNLNRSGGDASSDSQSQVSHGEEDGVSDETIRAKPAVHRPSLSERTIETLSQIPSSPALKGRPSMSTFFEGGPYSRSPSRPRPGSSRSSRPGSSHLSDSSNRPPSRAEFSRPGSSSGQGPDGIGSSLPTSARTLMAPMATIDGTPVRGRTTSTLRTPATGNPGGRVRSRIPSPPSVRTPRSRTPSPEKRSHATVTPRYASKTMAARTPQPRPSVSGLFKKPSIPALKKPGASGTPRKVSVASQKSSRSSAGTNASSTSSTSTLPTVASSESASASASRKSSAALREQISKARAAKRAASRQASTQAKVGQPAEKPEASVIPTDTTFDFGLADDPFNLNSDAKSTARIIQSRVASARTSGRLNIAAMGLKEIPVDVMNMYDLEAVGSNDGSWAESVDLTRFVAADNELEMIEESMFPDVDPQEIAESEDFRGSIFNGLETLDLHGNMLIALPAGLRRLTLLASLNLSSNRLANNCLEIISQITPLRDLKLSGNLLWGQLEPCLSHLINLEILDLHGNNLQELPPSFAELHRLRILNISENSFESLPFDILSKLPLTEVNARKNKLCGVLMNDSVEIWPTIQNLNVSSNQLTSLIVPNGIMAMPALTSLCVSMNRLTALPDITSWFDLVTLAADENNISVFPDGFTSLKNLRSVDFSSNDIRTVPPEISRMDNLAMLRLSGNPLRDKKFVSAGIDEIKETLAVRLEPPPINDGPQYELGRGAIAEAITSNDASPVAGAFKGGRPDSATPAQWSEEPEDENTENFTTPPTSAPSSPARPRSGTTNSQVWPVKAGGVLDRSSTQISSLHPVICSKLANEQTIREIQIHHNLFTALPDTLTFFAETLTYLSLAHNQLVGETYLGGGEDLDLPALKELNLSSNHITGLMPLVNHLHAPSLEKIDVSINRIASLPTGEKDGKLLRDVFPKLTVLLVANNHLADLDPESIKGMRIVDANNNDIAHLNPRIGLLGGAGGLERLEVTGNRFRVPRWNVLERGTEATLRWLRGRVPVAEMAAWKGDAGEDAGGDDLD